MTHDEGLPPEPHGLLPNMQQVPYEECDWAQRGFAAYRAALFPDDEYLPKAAQEALHAGFGYFGPALTDESVQATFQGLDGFFRPGATILDIGSGRGRAVDEMITMYGDRKVTILGLDEIYAGNQLAHEHQSAFVAGSWDVMPLADNTFSGLLSCESFPVHAWLDSVDKGHAANERTIREITRVAQPGAVWRATTRGILSGLPNESLLGMLLDNGWEVYFTPGLIVARLIKA